MSQKEQLGAGLTADGQSMALPCFGLRIRFCQILAMSDHKYLHLMAMIPTISSNCCTLLYWLAQLRRSDDGLTLSQNVEPSVRRRSTRSRRVLNLCVKKLCMFVASLRPGGYRYGYKSLTACEIDKSEEEWSPPWSHQPHEEKKQYKV